VVSKLAAYACNCDAFLFIFWVVLRACERGANIFDCRFIRRVSTHILNLLLKKSVINFIIIPRTKT